jgi:hypothetical protein
VDNETLDAVARSLAGGTSRRRLVRILGGGVLAATLGLAGSGSGLAAPSADARKRRHHRCIRNTPPFNAPARACKANAQCCGGGRCCDFDPDDGPGCFDLLTNQGACGTTCENVVNCINFDPDRQCVNGECVVV